MSNNTEVINCSYIVIYNNNHHQCKFKSTNQYNNIYYCTRHYNILKLKNDENKLKNDENKLKNDENKLKGMKINDNIDTNTSFDLLNIINLIPDLSIFKNLTYLNKGTFNEVYKIVINDTVYALKYQNLKNVKNILYCEYILLSQTFNNNANIITTDLKCYYYKHKQYAILLTEYMEMKFDNYKLSINSIELIKNIGIQLINAIKYIHQKKYLYIDLKPDNIMFNKHTLKLIDFNLCSKYIDLYSRYYTNDKLNIRQGNDIYSSRNINSGFRGVRIDDIESILYILLDLLNVNDFIQIKKLNKIKTIINKKKEIFSKKYEYDFINNFIDEINKYVLNDTINSQLQNKTIIYNNFIAQLL